MATTADYNSSYYFGTDNTYIYKQLEINQRNETTFLAMKKHKFSPITFLSFHKDAFTQENRFSIEVEKYDPDSIKFANSVSEKIDWEWMSPRVSLRSWNKQWTFSIWVLRWPNEKNAGYNMREILIESANIWKDSSQLLSDSQTWAKINMIWDAIVSSLSQTSDSKVASIPALPQDYVRKNLSSEKYQQNQLLMGQKLLAFAKENFDPKEYEYGRPDRTIAANDPSRRGFDLDKDWKKWMDCSSFIFFTLEKFWYNLGENKPIDTWAYWSPWDFDTGVLWKRESGFSDYAKNHFDIIQKDFQPWDMMLLENPDWSHHIAFVERIKDWEIMLYGMQTPGIGYMSLSNQTIIAAFRINLDKLSEWSKTFLVGENNISSQKNISVSSTLDSIPTNSSSQNSNETIQVSQTTNAQLAYQNILWKFKDYLQDSFYQQIFSNPEFLNSQDPEYWSDIQQKILLQNLKSQELTENERKFLNAYFPTQNISDTDKKINRVMVWLYLQEVFGEESEDFSAFMKENDYWFSVKDDVQYKKYLNNWILKLISKYPDLNYLKENIQDSPTKNSTWAMVLKNISQKNPEILDELKQDIQLTTLLNQVQPQPETKNYFSFQPNRISTQVSNIDPNQVTQTTQSDTASDIWDSSTQTDVQDASQTLTQADENLTFDQVELKQIISNFSLEDRIHFWYFEDLKTPKLKEKNIVLWAIIKEMQSKNRNIDWLDSIIKYVDERVWILKLIGDVSFDNKIKVSKESLYKMLSQVQQYK